MPPTLAEAHRTSQTVKYVPLLLLNPSALHRSAFNTLYEVFECQNSTPLLSNFKTVGFNKEFGSS